MNELDKRIQSARKRRFIQTAVIGGLLFIALLGYLFWLFLTKGYALTIFPEEARAESFVNLREGQGFYLGGVLYIFSNKVTAEVGSTDFETTLISIDHSKGSPVSVTLTLKPLPGTLRGRTEPSDEKTEWSVNNELVHIGSSLEHTLPPGDYQVAINHPFFLPQQETVTIQRNRELEKQWSLQALTGRLTINTVPEGASIYLDETLAGVSPLSLEKPAGAHKIKVTAEGYESLQETVEITNKSPQIERRYQLALRKANLPITLSPAGGELSVDGIVVTPTSQNGRDTLALTANRKHTLRYRKPGYFTYEKTLEVTEKPQAIDIALKKEFGKVNIRTSPAATIMINGKAVGKSSFSGSLPAVSQTIDIIRQGYRRQTHKITPSSRSPKNLTIKLLSEFAARRKEGRPLFVSTLGIELLSVKPGNFVMGSPANEKGRRRNEFQVNVDFSRKIWVSRHEITEAQYAAFDPSKAKSRLPVSNISWSDAAKYCNWLSEQEGLPVFYKIFSGQVSGFYRQAKGYRLLTEAEWEWLAKKSKRAAATVYVWGNNERIPRKAGNFADKTLGASATFYLKNYDDGFADKAPVGSFKADRLGLYDLAGNVSEWVNDKYTHTPPTVSGTAIDYIGASRGRGHIYKGANYRTGRQAELRAAFRESEKTAAPTIGFRIARYQ